MEKTETVLYLFCFARPSLDLPPNVPAVDKTNPVFVQHFPAAAAVLSEVSVGDFCGPRAERRLQDLAWVGPRAFRHEQLIEAIMSVSPVLPACFGTLFSSMARLREFVEGHSPAIAGFLEQVDGHQEWGVKVMLDRGKAREAALPKEQEAGLSALPPGARYIQRQRILAEWEKSLGRRVQGICREVADNLRSHAASFAERRVLARPDDADTSVETLSNWAFLLPLGCATTFWDAVQQANSAQSGWGLTFHASGPWPPYSFAPPLAMKEGS